MPQKASGTPDSSDRPELMAAKVQVLTRNGGSLVAIRDTARREVEVMAILHSRPHPNIVSGTSKVVVSLFMTGTLDISLRCRREGGWHA